MQIRGIPPKSVDWRSIKDVASSLGMLVKVDWPALFAIARVRIKCKNPKRDT